MSDVTR